MEVNSSGCSWLDIMLYSALSSFEWFQTTLKDLVLISLVTLAHPHGSESLKNTAKEEPVSKTVPSSFKQKNMLFCIFDSNSGWAVFFCCLKIAWSNMVICLPGTFPIFSGSIFSVCYNAKVICQFRTIFMIGVCKRYLCSSYFGHYINITPRLSAPPGCLAWLVLTQVA